MCMISIGQIRFRHLKSTTNAFSHILPCHFKMYTTRISTLCIVHLKELLNLS